MAKSASVVKAYSAKAQHTLTIEDMDKRMDSYPLGGLVTSTVFGSPESPEHRWFLRVYPSGEKEELAGHVSVYLAALGPDRRARYTFSAPGTSYSAKTEVLKNKKGSGRGKFQSHAEAKAQGSVWRLSVEVELETAEALATEVQPAPKSQPVNLSALLFSDHLSDFALQVEGERISVHRMALSVGSEVFAAMFRHPETAEGRTGVAVVQDASAAAVKAALRFIYTRSIGDGQGLGTLCEVLKLGRRFMVAGLAEAAEEALGALLDETNLLQVLAAARLHGSHALLVKAQALFAAMPAAAAADLLLGSAPDPAH